MIKNKAKATRNVVKMAATTLILASGVTTTLEVKNYLRQRGYLAFQNDISEKMLSIAHQLGWAYLDNGIFRIYTFPQLGVFPQ